MLKLYSLFLNLISRALWRVAVWIFHVHDKLADWSGSLECEADVIYWKSQGIDVHKLD